MEPLIPNKKMNRRNTYTVSYVVKKRFMSELLIE